MIFVSYDYEAKPSQAKSQDRELLYMNDKVASSSFFLIIQPKA